VPSILVQGAALKNAAEILFFFFFLLQSPQVRLRGVKIVPYFLPPPEQEAAHRAPALSLDF
jgi:hypothetical protein